MKQKGAEGKGHEGEENLEMIPEESLTANAGESYTENGATERRKPEDSEVKGEIMNPNVEQEEIYDGQEHLERIPLMKLETFAEHPYTIVNDEEMGELMEAVARYGVVEPILVRPKENGMYEILSGHRRVVAATMAGFMDIPARIMECDDDEAVFLVCDSNLHRTVDYRSQCHAVSLQLRAMNHQGKRGDGMSSAQRLGKQMHVSDEEIRRMDRRAQLSDSFFEAEESGKLKKTAMFHLACLKEEQQQQILDMIWRDDFSWDEISQVAEGIKKLTQSGKKLTVAGIMSLLKKEKSPAQHKEETIAISLSTVDAALGDENIQP